MKVSRKVKIITAIGVIGVAVVAIACASSRQQSNGQNAAVNVTKQSTAQWEAKAPQLFNNLGFTKLIESNPINPQQMSDSQAELAGTITNPFGIRDDILDYIINNVSNEPKYALKAAITLARNEQAIYYGAIGESQALQLANENSLIRLCLLKYLGDEKWDSLTKHTQLLLRNTKARDEHMWDVDTKVFGWKVIGSDLTGAEMDAACIKGDF